MAKVGCLGDVIFTVSREIVLTPGNIQWNSSANYQTHDRHLMEPALEFTGLDADEISFDIHLSVFLGVSPMEQMTKLFEYERKGTLLPLTIGNHAYGKYKWVIVSTSRKLTTTDKYGNIVSADVGLKLKSYIP